VLRARAVYLPRRGESEGGATDQRCYELRAIYSRLWAHSGVSKLFWADNREYVSGIMVDAIERRVILDFHNHVLTDNREQWDAFLTKKDDENLGIALEIWDREWPGQDRKKKLLEEEFASRRNLAQDVAEAAKRAREVLQQNTGKPDTGPAKDRSSSWDDKKVFVVHGRDEVAKEKVARFIQKAGLNPIILHEQSNQGRTIIEKFERHTSDVGFAVVLLTPDDVGRSKRATKWKPRARQNVIAELFYFMGKIGRDRVCALKKGNVEEPSDIAGVTYIDFNGGEWKGELLRELGAAGYTVDWEKAFN